MSYKRHKNGPDMIGKVKRCYTGHQPIALWDDGPVVYGGSCSSPVVTDADVYVGLDCSMRVSRRAWPWRNGTEFLFPVSDRCAPDNPSDFRDMVEWLVEQVFDGKKVHVGCIGGHGRTGTVLAAMVSLCGTIDAIGYVREHYCEKAVESKEQVDFLVEYYGVTRVEAREKKWGDSCSYTSFDTGSGRRVMHLEGTRWSIFGRVDDDDVGSEVHDV